MTMTDLARLIKDPPIEYRPELRWWLDLPPFGLSTVEAGASPLQRVLVLPRDTRAMRRFYRGPFPEVSAPAGFEPVARNAGWRVLAAPECLTRPRA